MPWLQQGQATNRQYRKVKTNSRLPHGRGALFLVLFAAIGGILLLNATSAEERPVAIYLAPDTRTVAPNTEFRLQLRLDTGAAGVNAVQAGIDYPAELIQLIGVDYGGSRFTTAGPGSDTPGKLVISRGVAGSESGDQTVATLRFRSLGVTGSAAIAFNGNTYVYEAGVERDILGGPRSTRGATVRIDGQAPAVTLDSPSNGVSVRAGRPVKVSATARDELGTVARVEFYVNSVKMATVDSPPYTFDWNTYGYSAGSRHTLHAQAVDAQGNVGASQSLKVTLDR